jgi:CheY-like chemotaxis protein
MQIVRRSLQDTLFNSEQFFTALAKLASTLTIVLLVLFLSWRYQDSLKNFLEKYHPSSMEGFGFKVAFESAAKELERLPQQKQDQSIIPLTEEGKGQILARLKVVGPLLNGRRILWVDDMPEYQIQERAFLEAIGISIDTAQSSETAYDLYCAQQKNGTPYDLVISDVKRGSPPVKLGFLMGEKLQRMDPEVDLLFYTAEAKDIQWWRLRIIGKLCSTKFSTCLSLKLPAHYQRCTIDYRPQMEMSFFSRYCMMLGFNSS